MGLVSGCGGGKGGDAKNMLFGGPMAAFIISWTFARGVTGVWVLPNYHNICRMYVVCLSVTRMFCDKTTEARITQFSLKSSQTPYF